MGNRVQKSVIVAAFIIMFVSLLKMDAGAEEKPLVIRVGVYESNGFIALNEENKMAGYGTDFMEMLEKYANVKYEYVQLSWSECMQGLLEGTVDIVTDARKTDEREELYDFSVQSIGQIQGAIFVKKDMQDIYYNDFDKISTLKIGFEKDSANEELYREYALRHGFVTTTLEYASHSDLLKALNAGEIDAIGNNTHLYTNELKVVAVYNTSPNYIMGPKNSTIMNRINLAMEQMYADHPELIEEQYSKLTCRQVYQDLLLTREEAEYRETHPIIKVAVPDNRIPASWYDDKSDSFQGIAIDMMKKLSKKTGLTFEYIRAKDTTDAAMMIQNGQADIGMPFVGAEDYQGDIPLRITSPMYSLSIALVVEDEKKLMENQMITVAVTESNKGIADMLTNYFDNITIMRFETSQDCIDAVHSGEADAYANALYEVEYCLKNPRNDDLHIANYYMYPIDYCLGMRSDETDELYGILNNGINMLTDDEKEQIIRYYSIFKQYDFGFWDKLYENRYLLVCIGVFLWMIILGWWWYSVIQRRAMTAIRQKSLEAQRANEAKSDFLARMSHDMRTPMNGILGITALAEDKEMSDDVRNDFRQIDMEGHFLLSLINDTLDMSKIEKKQITLEIRPVNTKEVLEQTLSLVNAYAEGKKVKCGVSVKDMECGYVFMDRLRVQQVILNILSNAVKFSKTGGSVELYAECYKQTAEMVYDKFVITDHGIGMNDEFIPKMFEPFEQEERCEDANHYEGSGLGMSITKQLIELMQGNIEVKSQKGKGTTVTVYLNFKRCTERDVFIKEKTVYSIPENTNILLCEDNAMNTVVARGLLEKVGCNVTCASNGKEGVSIFEHSDFNTFDMILMDIRMPVMDGVSAASAIRALEREDAKTTPIVALTANAYEDEVKRYLENGMNGHVSKPIDPDILYETIGRLLRKN